METFLTRNDLRVSGLVPLPEERHIGIAHSFILVVDDEAGDFGVRPQSKHKVLRIESWSNCNRGRILKM